MSVWGRGRALHQGTSELHEGSTLRSGKIPNSPPHQILSALPLDEGQNGRRWRGGVSKLSPLSTCGLCSLLWSPKTLSQHPSPPHLSPSPLHLCFITHLQGTQWLDMLFVEMLSGFSHFVRLCSSSNDDRSGNIPLRTCPTDLKTHQFFAATVLWYQQSVRV